ncbi:retrovirus-related pol polyprotein from transposon TNT 1-94 [Tanacetum coccineum]
MKAEALKKQTTASRPIKALTVYPPNTPATLVPRMLPTKSQALTKEIKEMKDIFEELEAKVEQNAVNRKHDEIERKNILIALDNLIVDCLSKDVFYIVTNSELTVSRFTKMHDAHTIVQARCLELEAELSNLHDKLKYQNLKESFGNNPPPPARVTPDFDSVFVIGKMKASLQGKDNAIKKLKMQISQLKETRSEADRTLDFRALDFHITHLTEKVTVLQEQNELFRAENEKVKHHYKELYDSIKITRAKHIEQITALLTKNENLKAQIQNKMKCVTKDHVKPTVLAPGKYAIDVEPIPPRNRNNREVHLDYLKQLKESVETLRETVKEAKVERPLDRSIVSACRYTKHSQELLEYVIGTCPNDFNQRDKKHAPTPLIRKKQVAFEAKYETSNSITHKHVEQLHTQKTNVLMPPSTGVNSCTDASGSQPRSNTKKKNRISLAKSVNETKVIQIVLWYLDSGCSKHMMRDRSRLRNFMNKFIRTVRWGMTMFGAIMGYRDYVIGDSVISRVYYVERLGHNLFSVRQFCDSDLEVAFRKHSCFVRDTDGVELIKGSRGSNLYTISVEDMMNSYLICLLSRASKNKSWLWHRRLNHLNFDTINDLARKDLVRGLPRLKFEKDNLCSVCQLGKSKKHTHKPKTENTNLEVLHTIHMDLCIFHQKSVPRTPQQNDVVERQNRTLVEAARTMLIFFKAPMFLWAEVVATAFFGALCYPTNDSEDLGKLQLTADIGIFVGYAPSRKSGTPSSTTIDQDAPSPSHSPSSFALQSLSIHQGVAAESTLVE